MVDEYAVTKAQKILQNWKASSRQIDSILPLGVNEKELEERSRLILQIDQALKIMFNNPDNINGFMRMPNHNDTFKGKTPLEVVSSGGLNELIKVFNYLKEGLFIR
ncbi:antitoxin Xre/MbcA/ParS toxin-binding domain-containing protein [Thalassotalea agarivorans]|uniref:Antitoxin Xre/MbcA/ParS-like toxin-binding domain-containing protein n=1 Tax=Thalassotalea agarivorans TaxID=349064 RepID=A0A1I0BGG6_THASX|nr:antitoxin Xre/MbcA/ParS toxin-binding domain-containing protein [Thalassotalea agarivorans]SET05292.1 Protein of unknown function [Thalassotalea agarivorans]